MVDPLALVERFDLSLRAAEPPPDFGNALQAVWWAAKGDWDRAHDCAQNGEGDRGCDLVHAHLHRWEGDVTNARYWYRRAGAAFPSEPLPEERRSITIELLSQPARLGEPE